MSVVTNSTVPFRSWSIKVQRNRELLDVGPGRHLVIRNDGSDPLYLALKENGAIDKSLMPGGTLTIATRRFIWSNGRARVNVKEFESPVQKPRRKLIPKNRDLPYGKRAA